MFNFALGYFTPPAFVSIKWRTYLIFGVFSLCMAIHAFFMFPETAGKTLEEVEYLFADKVPAWKTRVDFNKIRAFEHGDVDPEKLAAFRGHSTVSEKDANAAASATVENAGDKTA